MADSFVTIPPDSTGKSLDTRTVPDGNHREVIVVGSPTLADVAEADATNGLDVDVTRLPSLVAGNANIGDVDIASLPNEGQQTMAGSISVAIASDQSTVPVSLASGGTTQYAEDTAHVSGDLVTMAGVVQQTADAALSTDGDRSALQVDATGWAKVNVKSSVLPSGAATAALQTQPGVDVGDVTVNNAAGASAVNVQDGGNSLTVDGTVTADTELPAAAALADNTANPTVPAVGAFLMGFDGTNWDRLQTGAATGGALKVDASATTQPVSGTVTANQGTAGTAWEVVGDVAADIAVPANPLSIGGRASTAVPTAVSADGDSVYNWLNRNGLQVVSMIPGAGLNADPYTQLSIGAQYTTTQTSAVLLAGGASERIIITSIQIQVGGTTAGTLQVYFGTGAFARGTNSAIFDGEFAPSATLKPGFFAAPAGGFRSPTLGHDILVTTSAALNPLTITCWYYILGV